MCQRLPHPGSSAGGGPGFGDFFEPRLTLSDHLRVVRVLADCLRSGLGLRRSGATLIFQDIVPKRNKKVEEEKISNSQALLTHFLTSIPSVPYLKSRMNAAGRVPNIKYSIPISMMLTCKTALETEGENRGGADGRAKQYRRVVVTVDHSKD